MLYYLHTNEYVHGYVVFNFLQPFLMWRRNDHMFDHLRIWTTWKQWEQEYRKASVADTKDLEMLGKSIKNFLLCLRDQKVVGSSPVASTIWNVYWKSNLFRLDINRRSLFSPYFSRRCSNFYSKTELDKKFKKVRK